MSNENYIPEEASDFSLDRQQDEISKESSIREHYRGVWAKDISDGTRLPVGGSVFSTRLTTFVELDFSSFADQMKTFNRDRLEQFYKKDEASVHDYLKQFEAKIDPYLFYTLTLAQNKTDKLLEVDHEAKVSQMRSAAYANNNTPKLSELKGISACAERAALGQYLLQELAIDSAYCSGITFPDKGDLNDDAVDHSFIVVHSLEDDQEADYIFDISRPHNNSGPIRVLKADTSFNYSVLEGQRNVVLPARDVLSQHALLFGVGDAMVDPEQGIVRRLAGN